jgi:dTDP-4-dehydrorhamnose reductase
MRATLFGATGLLGKALIPQWTSDPIVALNSTDADLRDPQQVLNAIKRTPSDWIILAAAYTDVDGCETNSKLAFEINCHGAVNVAQVAKQVGSRLLFLSSDYVFDGTKTTPYETGDPRGPRSVYGQSKAEAEIKLQDILPDCCILRTSWLFGAGGKCFPDTILKLAATRPSLDVVDDQRGSPTYTPDLSRAIIHLCHAGASGIVHATNRGGCSWFEFARQIVQRSGLPAEVRPTTTEKFPRPAPRPKYSVLSPASLDKFHFVMPSWQDALDRYLAERASLKTA